MSQKASNVNSIFKSSNTLKEWWEFWVNPTYLKELPDFMGTWNVPSSTTSLNNAALNAKYILQPIGSDGQPTTDKQNAAGLLVTNKRTQHSVYYPVTGVLLPRDEDIDFTLRNIKPSFSTSPAAPSINPASPRRSP